MWVCCHVVKNEARVRERERVSGKERIYNQLAAINCPELLHCQHCKEVGEGKTESSSAF